MPGQPWLLGMARLFIWENYSEDCQSTTLLFACSLSVVLFQCGTKADGWTGKLTFLVSISARHKQASSARTSLSNVASSVFVCRHLRPTTFAFSPGQLPWFCVCVFELASEWVLDVWPDYQRTSQVIWNKLRLGASTRDCSQLARFCIIHRNGRRRDVCERASAFSSIDKLELLPWFISLDRKNWVWWWSVREDSSHFVPGLNGLLLVVVMVVGMESPSSSSLIISPER